MKRSAHHQQHTSPVSVPLSAGSAPSSLTSTHHPSSSSPPLRSMVAVVEKTDSRMASVGPACLLRRPVIIVAIAISSFCLIAVFCISSASFQQSPSPTETTRRKDTSVVGTTITTQHTANTAHPPHHLEYWDSLENMFFSKKQVKRAKATGSKTGTEEDKIDQLTNENEMMKLQPPQGVAHIGDVRKSGYLRRGVLVYLIALPSQRVLYQRRSRQMKNFPLTFSILGEHHDPDLRYFHSHHESSSSSSNAAAVHRNSSHNGGGGGGDAPWDDESDISCAYRGLLEELGWKLNSSSSSADESSRIGSSINQANVQNSKEGSNSKSRSTSTGAEEKEEEQEREEDDARFRSLRRRLFSGARERLPNSTKYKYDHVVCTDMLLLVSDEEFSEGIQSAERYLVEERERRLSNTTSENNEEAEKKVMAGREGSNGAVHWRVDPDEVESLHHRRLSDMYRWLRYEDKEGLIGWSLWTRFIVEGIVSICKMQQQQQQELELKLEMKQQQQHHHNHHQQQKSSSRPHRDDQSDSTANDSFTISSRMRMLTDCSEIVADDAKYILSTARQDELTDPTARLKESNGEFKVFNTYF